MSYLDSAAYRDDLASKHSQDNPRTPTPAKWQIARESHVYSADGQHIRYPRMTYLPLHVPNSRIVHVYLQVRSCRTCPSGNEKPNCPTDSEPTTSIGPTTMGIATAVLSLEGRAEAEALSLMTYRAGVAADGR